MAQIMPELSTNVDSTINNMQLPSDVIIEIISHLANFSDLLNCMLLSKEIRNMIFATPAITQRIRFKINTDRADFYHFICRRGSIIRHLNLKDTSSDFELVIDYLSRMPHLEDLLLLQDARWSTKRKKIIENDLYIEKLQKINNLRILKIKLDDENPNFITKLVCRQNNLKELSVTRLDFPARDISEEVKFQLESLEILQDNDHVLKFLQTQAENLKVFLFRDKLSFELCELIFGKFKKLETLVIDSNDSDNPIYNQFFSQWKLESLRNFEETGHVCIDIQTVLARFPNLENVKCLNLGFFSGISNNLMSLSVFQFDCWNLLTAKFPNLKNLSIKRIITTFYIDYERFIQRDPNFIEEFYAWTNFIEGNQNIENIEISDISGEKTQSVFYRIVKSLKYLKNLKTFKIQRKYKRRTNVQNLSGQQSEPIMDMYKVVIDTQLKTVQTSEFIAENVVCAEILDSLRENFEGFDFSIIVDETTHKKRKLM